MDAGGIDGMDGMNARHNSGNDRPGELVDDLAEVRILLRRPADDREWPNRIGTMIDVPDVQNRKRMRQTVIPEMIAEGPFWQKVVRNGTGDTEIRFRDE